MKNKRKLAALTMLGILTAFLSALPSPSAVPMPQTAGSGGSGQTLAERLGHSKDTKLLIVHADDLAVSHSVNVATFRAMDAGLVNSASIMTPCPWLPEVAEYAKAHPDADLGLHLTLTSEWEFYKWGPVSSSQAVPTLINNFGYLYSTVRQAVERMNPQQVEQEIRSQVKRAMAVGIKPTHLDSHMGTLFQTRDLFQAYLNVGKEFGLPVLIAKGNRPANEDYFGLDLGAHKAAVIDRLVSAHVGVGPHEWQNFYTRVIEDLQPGVTQLIIHLAYDDSEMQAVTAKRPHWYEAAWRQRDFDFFTSERFAWLLRKHRVQLVTWREIGRLLR